MSANGDSSPAVARITASVGAVGSEAALLHAGYHGEAHMPVILLVLFTGWVLAPFGAYLMTGNVAKRWTAPVQTALHRVMLLVTLVALTMYGLVVLSPPRRPAVIFLLVPLGSLVLMSLAVAIGRSRSRNRSR